MNKIEINEYINKRFDIEDKYNTLDNLLKVNKNKLSKVKTTGIIGTSGTGKTTILKNLSNDLHMFNFNENENIIKILIDNYKIDIEEVIKLFFDVGLSCVPVWKNNYKDLSNGEKFKFEFAYKILSSNDTIYIDEFTSLLDRDSAEKICGNLEKLLTKYNKNLVFASCHFDILDFMKVDQIIDTNNKSIYLNEESKKKSHLDYLYMKLQEDNGRYLKDIII